MKTISVKQPWASLLCSGIKDVENRTWKTEHRGKILIHASATRVSKRMMEYQPLEILQLINDHIQLGNIENIENFPTSAIIGYVEIKDCVTDSESIWAEPVENWIIDNAYLFDEPIPGVKGKLNIFDYPEIDENNLPPAHKVEIKLPYVDGDTLIVPVTEDSLEGIENTDPSERGFALSLIPELHGGWLIKNEDEMYYPPVVSKVKFVANNKERIYDVEEIFFGDRIDDEGKIPTYFSLFNEDEVPWGCIQINLK